MSKVLLDLIGTDQLGRVTRAFEQTISASFVQDRTRVTHLEVRRRFDICARVIRALRGDLRWGLDRVLDHLPRYLRCELDGIPWTPDARTVWAPGDDGEPGEPTGGRKEPWTR